MLDKILDLLKSELPGVEVQRIENCHPEGLEFSCENLLRICEILHANPDCYFDHLASLTGIDNGPEEETMEVIYNLYSIPNDFHLTLRVSLGRKKPEIQSVSSVWRGADWHEREAYDLYGIKFIGHPDLRRILLPADWKGYPMRKDYEEDSSYHGMTIKHPDSIKE